MLEPYLDLMRAVETYQAHQSLKFNIDFKLQIHYLIQ